MNIEQALIWMAIGAAGGFIIGYLLRMVMVKRKDNENQQAPKGRKKAPVKQPVPSGENLFANPHAPVVVCFDAIYPDEGRTRYDKGQSRIEVINITNCSFNTEPASLKREENRPGRMNSNNEFQNADLGPTTQR